MKTESTETLGHRVWNTTGIILELIRIVTRKTPIIARMRTEPTKMMFAYAENSSTVDSQDMSGTEVKRNMVSDGAGTDPKQTL